MIDRINELLKAVNEFSPKSIEEVEEIRLKYLSKKGLISELFNDFRTLAGDQKKLVGVEINKLKQIATDKNQFTKSIIGS